MKRPFKCPDTLLGYISYLASPHAVTHLQILSPGLTDHQAAAAARGEIALMFAVRAATRN